METWRAGQECPVQKGITELHRTLDSLVNFEPGEEVLHLSSVKDKWVNQEARDWDIRNLRIEIQVAEFRKASHG